MSRRSSIPPARAREQGDGGFGHLAPLSRYATASGPPEPPFEVTVDVEITRRKRFHIITDARGETVWADRLFGGIIDWLRAESQTEYILHTQGGSYGARVETLERQ